MIGRYKFGKNSLKQLATCEENLQFVANEAIKYSPIDFGIAEGHRDIIKQQYVYKEGLSDFDGITKKSKHNYMPSRAIDIYAFVNGKPSYDLSHLGVIFGIMQTIALQNNIQLEWGGLWKKVDGPHIEIK